MKAINYPNLYNTIEYIYLFIYLLSNIYNVHSNQKEKNYTMQMQTLKFTATYKYKDNIDITFNIRVYIQGNSF